MRKLKEPEEILKIMERYEKRRKIVDKYLTWFATIYLLILLILYFYVK
jgi:hypothetical protein